MALVVKVLPVETALARTFSTQAPSLWAAASPSTLTPPVGVESVPALGLIGPGLAPGLALRCLPTDWGMPTSEQLEDRRRSVVETALLALEDAQDARLLTRMRLRYLFERDPERAAEIGSWLS
jgi:hypothetical protein